MSAGRVAVYVSFALISAGAAIQPTSPGDHAVVVGRDDFGGAGRSLAVAVSGSIAWLGVGRNLKTVDVSDPSNPRLLNRLELGGGDLINDMIVASDRAYVLTARGVRVVDVSQAAHPAVVGSLELPEAIWLARSGTTLYVVGRAGPVSIVDVSNSAAPAVVGAITLTYDATGVAASGNLVFVATRAGLVIFDASSPAAPVMVGSASINSSGSGPIAVAGSTAYFATFEALLVFDVADATHPTRVGSLPWSPLPSQFDDIAVEGSRLYYTDYGSGSGRLRIVDVASPSSPQTLSIYSVPVPVPRAVAPSGDRVFLAIEQAGLHIVNVSDPATPSFEGALETPPGLDSSVAVSGTHAFLVDPISSSLGGGRLRVVDVSNPAAPTQVAFNAIPGTFSTIGSSQIAVSGSNAYIAAGDASLRIFDVSNPAVPAELGPFVLPHWRAIVAITLSDSVAYGSWGLVQAFDVSDPAAPFTMGNVSGNTSAAVAVAGTHAYAAGSGLNVLDVSNPYDMRLVGSVYGDFYSVAVDPSDDTAFASAWGRIEVIDARDPTAPVVVGTYDLPFFERVNLVASGSLLYAVGASNGLLILEASNREAPAVVGSYPVPSANAVAIQGDYIYVAAGYDGLYVLARDADDDGVGNPTDLCPASDASPTVVVGSCDTGVGNAVSGTGCTITDRIAQCAQGARNHGQFASCVAQVAEQLQNEGLIRADQRGRIVRCAGGAR